MNSLPLSGCSPVPLAHYLKALGILRLISEQADSSVTGHWERDCFCLDSKLDKSSLVQFFLKEYQPTSIIAPWNGGSGFFPSDNRSAINAIADSKASRLSPYKRSILEIQQILKELGVSQKPEADDKLRVIESCRNQLNEQVLHWLDAVLILTEDGAKYPPLLGTGGNDGRLEFTNNFMQQVISLIDPETGDAVKGAEIILRQSLFAETRPRSTSPAAIGQYFPGAAGGANSTSGFDGKSTVNGWDFILMIEGALLFAAASVKKLEASRHGQLIYPFCVRQSGVGYGSASKADEADARCEIWMPLWDKPTSLSELRAVFSEGRAQVNGKDARNGIDFSRAAVTFGVDRGLIAFQRYGFQVRNGLAYFATPLDRIQVRRNTRADLLSDIDKWMDALGAKTGPKANPPAPASVSRSVNLLEEEILQLCKSMDDNDKRPLQGVLVALGQCEKALANSLRWTTSDNVKLRPLCGLRDVWLNSVNTDCPEFRLALSLASVRGFYSDRNLYLRHHLEQVEYRGNKENHWVMWAENPSNDVVWHEGSLVSVLNTMFSRRVLRAVQTSAKGFPDWSPFPAQFGDITAFIEKRVDESLLSDLIWGLSLVDLPNRLPDEQTEEDSQQDSFLTPSSFYSLLRLCYRKESSKDKTIPVVMDIHRLATQGDSKRASALAARRLKASGFSPAISEVSLSAELTQRTAAALIFPVRRFSALKHSILRPEKQNT